MNALNTRRPAEDTKPWHQQFWPWFLIALPGSVVIAAFATLFIAVRHADDLVVDEYYKDGLAINRQLEKQQRARALGYDAVVEIRDGQVVVNTRGIADHAELRLLLSHPMEADRDFVIAVRRTDADRFSAALDEDVQAFWHWTLDGGERSEWRLDGSLQRADVTDGRAG